METQKVKPLIVFSNAMDCGPVLDALKGISIDQLHVNYYPYPQNYHIGRDFFLNNKQYTHYIPLAPDLVPDKYDLREMITILETKPDFLVYGPTCNVDTGKYRNHIAATLRLPTLHYPTRRYRWIADSQRIQILTAGQPIINPMFNGLSAPFIARSLIDCIEFCTLPPRVYYEKTLDYKSYRLSRIETEHGWSADLAFCHCLAYAGIKIHLDLRYKWEHLRYWGELQVGNKKPYIKLISTSNTISS